MLMEAPEKLSGNDRYEGFCIDLIKELAQMLGFNYTFIQQPDGKYGSCNKTTETCNGMLGKVQRDVSMGTNYYATHVLCTQYEHENVDSFF